MIEYPDTSDDELTSNAQTDFTATGFKGISEEAKLAYVEKLISLKSQAYTKANELYSEDGGVLIYDWIAHFVQSIPENFQCRSCKAFHILISSTESDSQSLTFLELPKPYSVLDFLNKMIADLDDKESCNKQIAALY